MPEKTILVVDDEKNVRLTLSRALEQLGRPIVAAVNGEDALQQLAQNDVGVMLLDLRMPGMDGMEVLRRVTEHEQAVRVIIITAHGTVANAVEAMKLGAVDFIQKPFSPDEVREVVRQVIERERLQPEHSVSYEDRVALAKRAVNDRRLDQAIEYARQAIALDPSRGEAFNLLGVLMEITGDQLQAQEYYRVCLDLDPGNRVAAANLKRLTHRQWETRPGPPELG